MLLALSDPLLAAPYGAGFGTAQCEPQVRIMRRMIRAVAENLPGQKLMRR